MALDGALQGAFAANFESIKSVDPYFDALCGSYADMCARIDQLKRQAATPAPEMEAFERRRQGVLDTILMIIDYWDLRARDGLDDEPEAVSGGSNYVERLVERTLETGTPTIHCFPLQSLKPGNFWDYVLTLSRRELNIEIRANPKTMRRLIAGPEFMKPYPGAVTGRYAGDLEEEVVQFHLSPCVSSIRLPRTGTLPLS
jgi:hypothetical protein